MQFFLLHKGAGVNGLDSFEVCISVTGGSGYLGGDGILQALKMSAAPGNGQLSSLGTAGYGVPNQQTMQGGALGQMGLQVSFDSLFCAARLEAYVFTILMQFVCAV